MLYDYSNIELKLLAWYLECLGFPEMAEVFREGKDLHIATASDIFSVPYDRVSDMERQIGKKLNFSIVYGGGMPTIIKQLKITPKEALTLLRAFHSTWPGIGWASKQREADAGTLVATIQERIDERGYITTLWGRHLHPRSAHSAPNALIQGCAADLMKWAMIQVHRWLKTERLQSHIVNAVYDELMLDALDGELDALLDRVPDLMTYHPIDVVVPIRPEPDVSHTTWAEKESYVYVPESVVSNGRN